MQTISNFLLKTFIKVNNFKNIHHCKIYNIFDLEHLESQNINCANGIFTKKKILPIPQYNKKYMGM